MDELLKDYKNTKQTTLKKLKNKENFWKTKESFIKNFNMEGNNKLYNSLPDFNNITNMIKSIPNPITNISNISNFAGIIGSSLKSTIYNQLNFENQGLAAKIQLEKLAKEKDKEEISKINL